MRPTTLLKELRQKQNAKQILGPQKLFLEKGCVHWSAMTGKMYGKRALGRPMTSRCLENQQIEGCICQKCYATRINQIYPAMGAALQRNRDLNPEDIRDDPPIFTDVDLTFRSNWNGDYEDERDVLVDFELCYVLDYVVCTAWTKNPDLVEAMDSYRPANFTLMQSSPMINQQAEDISPAANQVFTVYTAEYAAENDININCMGACRLCGRCYGKKKRTFSINELLKGDEIKYLRLMGLEL